MEYQEARFVKCHHFTFPLPDLECQVRKLPVKSSPLVILIPISNLTLPLKSYECRFKFVFTQIWITPAAESRYWWKPKTNAFGRLRCRDSPPQTESVQIYQIPGNPRITTQSPSLKTASIILDRCAAQALFSIYFFLSDLSICNLLVLSNLRFPHVLLHHSDRNRIRRLRFPGNPYFTESIFLSRRFLLSVILKTPFPIEHSFLEPFFSRNPKEFSLAPPFVAFLPQPNREIILKAVRDSAFVT